MAGPPELQPSKSDVASLIAIGIYIVIIGVMWNAPVLKSILYPFKARRAYQAYICTLPRRVILTHPY